ncbi:MAG TPA: hypothetical protein ACFCUC_02955 [Desulfobacterales bacterium]
MNISDRTLNFLAAFFWIAGGIVLLVKGGSLLAMAAVIKSGSFWPWVAGIGALILGAVKAKLLFAGACRRNLQRIAALKTPRFWQFFRPAFFAFLAVMVLAGAALSRLAHESYPAMLAVGFLDGSIGAALLASSAVFWKEHAFAARAQGGAKQ